MSLFGDDFAYESKQAFKAANMPGELPPYEWMQAHEFIGVKTLEELAELVEECKTKPYVAIDLETTGLDNRRDSLGHTKDRIVGICMSPDGKRGYYVPVRHADPSWNLPPSKVFPLIRDLCEATVIIVHNAIFDLDMLAGEDIIVESPHKFEDTLILSYLRDCASKRHGLKYLSSTLLGKTDPETGRPTGHKMFEIHELFPKGFKHDITFQDLDPYHINTLRYACADVVNTYLLYLHMQQVGQEQSAIYMIEKSTVAALMWMDLNTCKINLSTCERILHEIQILFEAAIEDIYESLEESFEKVVDVFHDHIRQVHEKKPYKIHEILSLGLRDQIKAMYAITSPMQLGEVFAFLSKHQKHTGFDVALEYTGDENSERRQVGTSEEVINRMIAAAGHRFHFLNRIGTYRTLQKIEGTYVRPIYEAAKKNQGFVRFSFNPYFTDTGRFSASKGDPNLGYSGINIQSTPACYNTAKILGRPIHERPQGTGIGALHQSYLDAKTKGGFIRLVHDGHFIRDNVTGGEFCIRSECDETCLFAASCKHGRTIKQRMVSLESSARLCLEARDEDHILVAVDQSGVELRVAANASRERKWIDEFFRCASCGHQFEQERSKGIAPPKLCPLCESDKIGDLHTLTCKIVHGEAITEDPKFKEFRQAAKCVVGSTRILSSQGLVTIESLKPCDRTKPDTFYPVTGLHVWSEAGVQEVSHFYDGGVQPTLRIKTALGMTLEGTASHRIRVYDQELGYVWRNLGSLKVGDLAVLDRGSDAFHVEILPHWESSHDVRPEDVKFLSQRRAIFDPILFIEDGGPQQVWDLTVPESESFWGNGFINHNSANFAILYGGGPNAVAAATGLSVEGSAAFRDKFLSGLPTLKRWFDTTISQARKQGYVQTLLGRRILLPDINHENSGRRTKAERNAINSIIQGTATGDLIRYAKARIYRELGKIPDGRKHCKLIITVHDELVFDIKKDKLPILIPVILSCMTQLGTALKWPVPLACDVELGDTWDVTYNWNSFTNPSPKTGLCADPVPKTLFNHIPHHPGMWIEDEATGDQMILVGRAPVGAEENEPVLDRDEPSNDPVHKDCFEIFLEGAQNIQALKDTIQSIESFILDYQEESESYLHISVKNDEKIVYVTKPLNIDHFMLILHYVSSIGGIQ